MKSAASGKKNPAARGREQFVDLSTLHAADLKMLPNDGFRAALERLTKVQQQDRIENQLLYYKPVTKHAEKIHLSKAHTIGVGGGNGSSKTETCLVELVALSTGIFPDCLREAFKEKFKGPRKQRVVVESITTTLANIILPKLQWWKWTGLAPAGGDRGHWGWIPKDCLKDGSWDRSWSEKTRTLTFYCRDPENPDLILGESSIQFMSHDQDPQSFASGDFDDILHDEPPRHAIWVENQARTMRADGRCLLSMTWPDDPSIPVDWIFDEIYDRGQPGANKNPDVEWIELYTTDNPHLDQDSVRRQMAKWSPEMQAVRIFGRPIRFSNRIHPLFTDVTQWWCFKCNTVIVPDQGKCAGCGSEDVASFNHVTEFDHQPGWPCVWVVDPHPRKPIMWAWLQIDPSDDLWMVAEGELDGDPTEVARKVFDTEQQMHLNTVLRLIDPNMGRSPSSASRRTATWQGEFEEAQLWCNLADDSEVGRSRINELLRPDERRKQPRLHFHARCQNAVAQFKRFVWDEYRRKEEKDLKQIPRAKNDDYPAIVRYAVNHDLNFRHLRHGAPVIQRAGKRRRGY